MKENIETYENRLDLIIYNLMSSKYAKKNLSTCRGTNLVLIYLYKNKQSNLSELSKILNVVPSRIVKIIDDLLSSGYIYKTNSPSDKRSYIIELTKDGTKIAKEIYLDKLAYLERVISKIGEDDFNKFLDVFEKIAICELDKKGEKDV